MFDEKKMFFEDIFIFENVPLQPLILALHHFLKTLRCNGICIVSSHVGLGNIFSSSSKFTDKLLAGSDQHINARYITESGQTAKNRSQEIKRNRSPADLPLHRTTPQTPKDGKILCEEVARQSLHLSFLKERGSTLNILLLCFDFEAEVIACSWGYFSAAFSAADEADLEEVGFDDIFKRVSFFAESGRQRFNAHVIRPDRPSGANKTNPTSKQPRIIM